jgi:Ca2+-binding EF-hand superfamily protein
VVGGALTVTDLDLLFKTFDRFDGDRNGRIDRAEFRRLLEALGGASSAELDLGFDRIDADRTGTIDVVEFSKWWTSR